MITRVIIACVFALARAAPCAAQVVFGRVVDDATGTPLSAVTVALLDAQGRTIARTATDSIGIFELTVAQAGSFSLNAQQLGFRSWTSERLDLRRNELLQVEVRLGRQAIPLQPLLISARRTPPRDRLSEFDERRNNPTRAGYYLTREEIERRPIATPTQQLIGIPGVTVRPIPGSSGPDTNDRSIIYLPTGLGGLPCMANVFVDGIPVRQSSGISIDDVIDPGSIGGVEVYARSAGAPTQYVINPTCGVVLFWSRPAPVNRDWAWPRIAIGAGLAVILAIIAF